MRQATATRSDLFPAKERILRAAIQRFARHSYEETSLRDIASDARADVAYVHRSFGSKEQLFAAALRATVKPDHLLPQGRENHDIHLARQILARDGNVPQSKVGPLDIVARSLSSPDAASVLRRFILDELVTPLSRHLDDDNRLRAAVIGALLMGLGIFRNVFEIEPLREARQGDLERLVATTIAHVSSFATEARSKKRH